ncbi:hypothetical protein NQ318_006039 [Aromia moschata]|uniref:Uncharacterized protein n=1 Tax=Aromia moschata TaxID=1265417 RepID=A0AAV8Z481_9CUCU|nr:hypothetical protein NQ318_006039 [Aromia moschata]
MCPKTNKLFCFICLVMGGNRSTWTQEGDNKINVVNMFTYSVLMSALYDKLALINNLELLVILWRKHDRNYFKEEITH